jgi:hypothetical protein
MQQISKKHAPQEKKNILYKKKNIFKRMMKNSFCQNINMQKLSVFLDEKYTPENMKNMHIKRNNILVKHAS